MLWGAPQWWLGEGVCWHPLGMAEAVQVVVPIPTQPAPHGVGRAAPHTTASPALPLMHGGHLSTAGDLLEGLPGRNTPAVGCWCLACCKRES